MIFYLYHKFILFDMKSLDILGKDFLKWFNIQKNYKNDWGSI